MPPKKWEEEDSDESSSSAASPPPVARRKFKDEEGDSDVADDWDAEDSEEDKEKKAKEAAAKAKAEAEAKANHKSRNARIAAHQAERARRKAEAGEDDTSSEEDELDLKARLRREQKEADLKHAEDLFGELDVTAGKNRGKSKHITIPNEGENPADAIDLSNHKAFQPNTKDQFNQLRDMLVQLLSTNSKKAQYPMFMTELSKELCKNLPSDQIKKVASVLTTLSNEKLKEEKAAEKGGKKSKAKAKVTLNANKDVWKADTGTYEDGLDDGDFM